MKRVLIGLSLFIAGCGGFASSSAPLEITKASSLKVLIYSGSPGSKSFDAPPDGKRFLAIEFVSKREAELKLKPDDVVLIDSEGNRYLPTGVAPFSIDAYQDFEGIVSGTVKIESPEGGAVTVGKEQKDGPTTFSMKGKNVKGTLIYMVPNESSGFQLKVLDSGPMSVTPQ